MSDIDELYSVPRDEFISARRELAGQVRAAGDPDAAARIEKLAKPTTSAWLANQLTRLRADEVAELADLGAELRSAYGTRSGAELRDLTRRRTDLINRLVTAAGEIGGKLSESITTELTGMLTAAATDETAAAALLAGRLTTARDLTVSGWSGGFTGPAAASAKPTAAPAPKERSRRELDEARAAVKEAEAARAAQERALVAAEEAVGVAEAEVRRLNAELDAAEAEELRARGEVQSARRAVKAAERAASLAWNRVQQVE